MTPAAVPFIAETVRIFNRRYYPKFENDVPNLGIVGEPKEDEKWKTSRDDLIWLNTQAPFNIRALIGSIAFDIGNWIDIHGIFSLNPDHQMNKRAIEAGAKEKLREFGCTVLPFRSSKTQLLRYIFTEAFKHASLPEKENLIQLASGLQPGLEATYSNFKRISIKISVFVTAVFRHEIVRISVAAIVALATFMFCVTLIKSAPLSVIQIATLVAGLGLVIFVVYLLISGYRNGRFFDNIRFITNILQAPPAITIASIIALIVGHVAYAGHQVIASSLHGRADRARVNYLLAGRDKALRVWLDLAEMRQPPPQLQRLT